MKYRMFSYISILICASLLMGWGTKEDNAVNFTGTLIPLDSSAISVENIKINHKTEFYGYQKPEKKMTADTHVIPLEKNPTETTEFGPFRLSTIKSIEVPEPDVEWIYQEPSNDQESKKPIKKYIEISIDATHYLVPKDTTISATDKNTKQGITIRKISHLKKLTITGYDLAEKENTKISPPVSS